MKKGFFQTKVCVVLSQDGSYRDIVEYFRQRSAEIIALDECSGTGVFKSKLSILQRLISTRVLKLRHWWNPSDCVLIIGWQALPILVLIKLRFFARPSRCVVMSCFVHSPKVRLVVNFLFKCLKFDGLGFIAFSRAERDNLVRYVGISESNVLFHLWRQELNGRPIAEEIVEGSYIFSGGYSNRDYDILLRALGDRNWRLMIVASSLNPINQSLYPKVEIFRDLPEDDFERKLAGSRLVVMPLKSSGDACGQSVLLRVLRNGKALIASRHESIEDYLGSDYPGFVPTNDMAALSQAIECALSDKEFHICLRNAIQSAHEALINRGSPGGEIYAFLVA